MPFGGFFSQQEKEKGKFFKTSLKLSGISQRSHTYVLPKPIFTTNVCSFTAEIQIQLGLGRGSQHKTEGVPSPILGEQPCRKDLWPINPETGFRYRARSLPSFL